MPVTLENYEDYQIKVVLDGGRKIRFFRFNDAPEDQTRARISAIEPYFRRMPPQHADAVFPILLLKGHPFHGHGGGSPPDVSRFMGLSASNEARREERIGVPATVIERIAMRYQHGRPRCTVHFIPLEDWNQSGRATTVIHEAAHGVDTLLSLHRRSGAEDAGANLRLEDLPEHLPHQACGHGTRLNRQAVNAYVAMTMNWRGVTQAQRRAIIATFRTTHAFRDVPETWWMTVS